MQHRQPAGILFLEIDLKLGGPSCSASLLACDDSIVTGPACQSTICRNCRAFLGVAAVTSRVIIAIGLMLGMFSDQIKNAQKWQNNSASSSLRQERAGAYIGTSLSITECLSSILW